MTFRLRELLHRRRMTVAKIARAIGSGRSHVQQVLSNTGNGVLAPGRGSRTRRKLVESNLLTTEELEELGWKVRSQKSEV